jgi:endonuclease-3
VGVTLFKKYTNIRAFAEARLEELEQDVRPTGFFRNKARNIRQACRMIQNEFGGRLPETMEDLLRLPGVGRKTANVLLGNVVGIPSMVVDTHVIRISNLLRLTGSRDPEVIERDLMNVVERRYWIAWSHWIGEHGRSTCIARRPQCFRCSLIDFCPSSDNPQNGK